MPPTSSLNPIDAIIALLTLLISPPAAAVIGPYATIFMASTAGAAWSIGRRDPLKRSSALWFFFRLNLTAFVVAAGVAVLLERWLGPNTRHWTIAPIALIIGAVGDDWGTVVSKIFHVVLRAFGNRISSGRDYRD